MFYLFKENAYIRWRIKKQGPQLSRVFSDKRMYPWKYFGVVGKSRLKEKKLRKGLGETFQLIRIILE